ncbi:MAG: methyltransferase domain-containing protein [Bacteroidetes bacterium]|nr:methyltransferase domain-containing protein [Bacteroidota bacterium]
MLLSNFEYVPLRLLRKFIFTEKLLKKVNQFIPYYVTSQNQVDPKPIVDQYEKYLTMDDNIIKEKTILEIGTGITNSSGYEMAAREWGFIYLMEPYAELDKELDDLLLSRLVKSQDRNNKILKSQVQRLGELEAIENQSIDLILSNSVLEHVSNLQKLFSELKRVLSEDGVMLHIVDYRDHFFKYPYHFLQFSRKNWDRFLNPGDLPVWRLDDSLQIIDELDLSVQILEQRIDNQNFDKIKPNISNDYDLNNPFIAVSFAVLQVKKN